MNVCPTQLYTLSFIVIFSFISTDFNGLLNRSPERKKSGTERERNVGDEQ